MNSSGIDGFWTLPTLQLSVAQQRELGLLDKSISKNLKLLVKRNSHGIPYCLKESLPKLITWNTLHIVHPYPSTLQEILMTLEDCYFNFLASQTWSLSHYDPFLHLAAIGFYSCSCGIRPRLYTGSNRSFLMDIADNKFTLKNLFGTKGQVWYILSHMYTKLHKTLHY